MSEFKFLEAYKVDKEDSNENREKKKHFFFPLKEQDVLELQNEIESIIPSELEELYLKIGYGFFHNNYKSDFNRLLSPDIVSLIFNREDQFEYDPDLEIYDDPNQLIFFEVNEGVYLTIDITNKKSLSPVYYFEDQVSDSIESFLENLDKNPEFLRQFEEE